MGGKIKSKKRLHRQGEWWKQINMVEDLRQGGGGTAAANEKNKNKIRVTGLTNNSFSKERECTYNDPDDFLRLLTLWQRENLSGTKKSLKLDASFKPEIFDCNVGKLPSNEVQYLEEEEQNADVEEEQKADVEQVTEVKDTAKEAAREKEEAGKPRKIQTKIRKFLVPRRRRSSRIWRQLWTT